MRPDYLPSTEHMPTFLEEGRQSVTAFLTLVDESRGHPIAEARQSITAVAASERLVALMPCWPGDPLLCVERLYVTTTDEAIELSTSYFLPGRYSYDVRLRRNLS